MKYGNLLLKINFEYIFVARVPGKNNTDADGKSRFRMMPQNGNLLLKISKVLLRSFSNQILIFCFKNKETIR